MKRSGLMFYVVTAVTARVMGWLDWATVIVLGAVVIPGASHRVAARFAWVPALSGPISRHGSSLRTATSVVAAGVPLVAALWAVPLWCAMLLIATCESLALSTRVFRRLGEGHRLERALELFLARALTPSELFQLVREVDGEATVHLPSLDVAVSVYAQAALAILKRGEHLAQTRFWTLLLAQRQARAAEIEIFTVAFTGSSLQTRLS